jgi:hypothetical protein
VEFLGDGDKELQLAKFHSDDFRLNHHRKIYWYRLIGFHTITAMRWLSSLLISALVFASPFPAAAQAPSPNEPRDPAVQARLDLSAQFLRMPRLLRDSRGEPALAGG